MADTSIVRTGTVVVLVVGGGGAAVVVVVVVVVGGTVAGGAVVVGGGAVVVVVTGSPDREPEVDRSASPTVRSADARWASVALPRAPPGGPAAAVRDAA